MMSAPRPVQEVSRPTRTETRVIERPVELDDRPITVVIAPPGFGKTTLLSQWYRTLRRSGVHPAWLSIDVRSVELADIERLIHETVCRLHETPLKVPFVRAINGVAEAHRVLFIDDVHLVDQRVIDDLIQWFSDLPGRPWRLVLAGRTTIHAAPRGGDESSVRELGWADLRLDDGDVDRAIRELGSDLSPSQRSALVERIDGWPAGLELVGQIVEVEQPVGEFVCDVVDTHQIVADYFEREVLSGLPISDQDFLIRSSVVAKPTGDACNEIGTVTCGADRLSSLSRLNAFVRSSDDGRYYEWLPMGRQFLLGRLRTLGQEPEAEARRRVLNWFLSQRRYEDAFAQASETDDWFAVVDLVLETGLDIIGCGRADDLISWLDRLPAEVVAAESGVAVLAAMALWVGQGDMAGDDINRWLRQAASSRSGRPPCQAESLSAAIDTGRAAFGRLGPRTRKLLGKRALRAEVTAETAWAALSHAAVGVAAYLDDEPREARRALTESLRVQTQLEVEPRRCVTRLFSPTALGVLALIELESGGYDNRAEALVSAAELQNPRNGRSAPGAEILGLAKSRAALAAGDHQLALELSMETARTARLVGFKALGYLDAASIYCEQGRAERSVWCLGEADKLLADNVDCGRLLTKRRRAIERQVQLGRAARWSRLDLLTDREAEVLRLLDSDLSRREIAQELYLSFETVKTYVQRLYQKLGVSSRAAAVATARAWGWLDDDGELPPTENNRASDMVAGEDARPSLLAASITPSINVGESGSGP